MQYEIQTEMKIFLINLSAAAKILGVSRPQIKNLVNGVYKTRKGLSDDQKRTIAQAVISELKALNINIFDYEHTT